MILNDEILVAKNRIQVKNLLPEMGNEHMREELIAGLRGSKPSISSKYFYNEEGSALFEKISQLEEYYPTRTEKGILHAVASELVAKYSGYNIIELGSGDCSKISILMDALPIGEAFTYIPLDVSYSAILNSAAGLQQKFPEINVEGYVLDFIHQFEVLEQEKPSMICFFGSTIGNFEQEEALGLMQNISKRMKSDDVLLMGMDMVKDSTILNAAYNDAEGVTEAFNKNVLQSVNSILESDFEEADFDHFAYFNTEKARIEMHLVANKKVEVRSPHLSEPLSFIAGKHIHTENSHKYVKEDIDFFAEAAGLLTAKIHTDKNALFSLVEFRKQ